MFWARVIICCSVGWLPVISPTTSATDISPQLSSSDCCRQYFATAVGSPNAPSVLAGEAIADVVDGGLPDVLAATVGDAAAVDDVAEPLADSLVEPRRYKTDTGNTDESAHYRLARRGHDPGIEYGANRVSEPLMFVRRPDFSRN